MRVATASLTRCLIGLLLLAWGSAQAAPPELKRPLDRQLPVMPRPPSIGAPPAPPPPGPPPARVWFDEKVSFGVSFRITWTPAENVASYVVERRFPDDPACCVVSSGPITTPYWTDQGLVRKGKYLFTVFVNYTNGTVGKGQIEAYTQGAENPVLSVLPLGRARAKLMFRNDITGTGGFILNGPGLPRPDYFVNSGPVETTLLPPGTHTWTIASVYAGGVGVVSPPADWGRASYTVNYGAGRFRISLEGFKAIGVTAEDIFRSDGRGDEVFITTQVNEYRRTYAGGPPGGLVSARMLRTPTFGDVQNFPARVRAGSASSTGGIMPTDQYPPPVQYISQLQPATTNNLPYLLWEGELTEIDGMVILSPAIWESDEDDRLVPSFAAFQAATAPFLSLRDALGPYNPGRGPDGAALDSWNPMRCPPSSSGDVSKLFIPNIGGWRDEPVDANQDHSYCPTYVAINWSLADGMTRANPATVREISFRNPVTNWEYRLYVRIERVR